MFFLFLLAHLSADYVFQPKIMAEQKLLRPFSACLIHIVYVAVLNVIAALAYILVNRIDWQVFLVLLILTSSHFGIDCLKSYLIKTFIKQKADSSGCKAEILITAADRLLHIAVMLAACMIISANAFVIKDNFIYRLTLLLTGFILSAPAGRLYIGGILKMLMVAKPQEDGGIKDYGAIIGIVERGAIFLAFVFNIFQVAVAVYALKAIIKFDEYKKGSQYYILGNLLSILFLTVSYAIYNLLLLL